MKRRELRRSPEAQRAWEERSRDAALERAQGREGARSTELRRKAALSRSPRSCVACAALVGDQRCDAHAGLRRTRRRATVHVPYAAKNEARRRSGGRCVVCGGKRRGFMEFHHVLPRRLFPALIKDPDNLVLVCSTCHQRHESAFRRIRRRELPACCLALASRVGSTAEAYMERTYPSDEEADAGRHPAGREE